MMNKINITLSSLTLAILLTANPAAAATGFSDMSADHFFAEDIQFMIDQELTTGYADGTFRPERTLTRAEAATFIARYEGIRQSTEKSSFPDVAEDHFAKEYIEGAMLAGYIEGFEDGTYRPEETLTREQMAVILDRIYPFEQKDHPFTDVSPNRYSDVAIQGLYGSGITEGRTATTFAPGDDATRGEFSALLKRTDDWFQGYQERERQALFDEVNEQIAEIPELRSAITWEHRDLIEATRRNVEHAIRENGMSEYLNLSSLKGAEEELRQMKDERTAEQLSIMKGEKDNGDFRTKTFDYNRPFAANSNKGAIESDETTRFERGNEDMKILLTAPHTTEHIRNEESKLAEIYTGAIAKLLHEYAGVHILYITRETEDVNFYHDVEFKREMARVVQEEDIDLVLDLHGAGRSRPFDLDIGTAQGTLVEPRTVNRLMAATRDQGFNDVYENHTFTASNSANIANYAYNELNVEAVQLEYNGAMRDPRQDLDSFYRTVYSLAEFILLEND